jgi:K(+)-stimulated pyrophosphate-energized sodium pump
MRLYKYLVSIVSLLFACGFNAQASEADLKIPDLHQGTFHVFGGEISSWDFLFYGAVIIAGTLLFSLSLFFQVKKLPVHSSMAKVGQIIYETCRTYLLQQGRFLLMLFGIIAVILCIYFLHVISKEDVKKWHLEPRRNLK